jgi:formylglycine-generating enzyme required for sulfatase activity
LQTIYSRNGYRLPTEAEWEYSCRAGTGTTYYWGNDSANAGQYAWYKVNSSSATHPVAKKEENNFGLYDMCGNVWEWCNDWYSSTYYSESPLVDPLGPTTGGEKILRGGSCLGGCKDKRSAARSYFLERYFYSEDMGLRCVLPQ